MGETEPAEISDVSEPTKEQTEEEENEEEVILEEGDSEEGEVTDEKPADQQEEQPSRTEIETEEIETEVPEVEETVAAVGASEADALEETEKAKTTISLYEKDAEGNPVALSADSAEVSYTGGCAHEDGKTVAKGSSITFLVLPKTGKKVKDKGVSYAVLDATDAPVKDTKFDPVPAANGIYTIDQSKVVDDKAIAILVETEAVTFTLGGNTFVKEETDAQGKKKLTTLTGDALKIAYGDASSITLNITAKKDAEYTAQAQIGDNAPTNLGTGSQTVISAADSSTGAELVYRTYTLNATELAGVDGNIDQPVTLNFTEKSKTTVKAAAADVTGATGFTLATQAVDSSNEAQKGYVSYIAGPTADSKYDAGDKVVFALTPVADTQYEIDAVTATLTHADDETKSKEARVTDVTDTFITDDADKTAGKKAYAAEIPADIGKDYTLNIAVTTKLKAEADTVTVQFVVDEAYAKQVTVKGYKTTPAVVEANKEYKFLKKDAGNEYKIAVSTENGYKLNKVEVKRTGKKKDTTEAAPDQTKDLIEEDVKDGVAVYATGEQTIKLEENIPVSDTNTTAYDFVADTVTITVGVEPDGAQEEKTVTIESKPGVTGGISCEVEVDEDEEKKVTYNKTNGTATIAEGTQYLSFRVKATTKPTVAVTSDGTAVIQAEELGAAGGYYSYQIPAKNFKATGGKVTVTRATKAVAAEVTGDAAVSWEYENEDNRVSYNPATVDADEAIVFTVVPGQRAITSVTYRLGENGADNSVEEGNGGIYNFEVDATDKITVKVVCETDEKIRVTQSDQNYLVNPGTTVSVDYEKQVSVQLVNKDGAPVDIINAMVYENGALAKTKPEVKDNVATFKVDEKEQNTDLTITLVKKKGEKVVFTIKSDAKVTGVSYDGEFDKDKTVVLSAGEYRVFRVDAEDGAVSKLKVGAFTGEIKEDSKIENATKYASNTENTVTASLSYDEDDDELRMYIEATAAVAKKDNAAMFVLCRPDGSIIPDSEIKVDTTDAIMKGEKVGEFTTVGSPVGKHIAIKMKKDHLLAIRDKMEYVTNGYAWYNVAVDTTAIPTAKPDSYETLEAWTADRAKIISGLEKQIGKYNDTSEGRFDALDALIGDEGLKLQLIPDDVAPVALNFKVTVTPTQKFGSAGTAVTGDAWTSDTITTTVPNYSDTLKLGKEKATVQTGRDEDIVVATPEFAGSDRYEWIVEPEIVDKATGMPRWNGTGNGCFEAKWDAVNKKVTINAKNAKAYINNRKTYNYKNLALKVTVYTENSDYGVSALKPLTVESGIEDMALNVQPEIVYNDSSKTVTVSSAVTYNPGYGNITEKDRAPKKKAASFRLENVGKALGSLVTIDPKNGKIKLDKGISLSANRKENQFTVVAKANDYETNTYETKTVVTVVAAAENFDQLALFDIRENETKARKADASAAEVAEKTDQYRVAALRTGAKPNRDGSYDLTDDENVVYPTELLSFKSGSKNVVIEPDGDITVNKVGKAKFTVQVKSEKRYSKTLDVTFVVENTPIVARLTEYENSHFQGSAIGSKTIEARDDYEAQGNTTGYYKLELVKARKDSKGNIVKNDAGEVLYDSFTLPNHSVSFKNAKKAANKDLGSENTYFFTATGGTGKNATVVTIKNKEKDKKSNEIVINILNEKRENAKNAPKLAMASKGQKIFSNLGWKQDVEIAVTSAKKGESIWDEKDDSYIVLSIDQSKTKDSNTENYFKDNLDRPIALERESVSEGRFPLSVGSNCPVGSYSLIASLGTMKGGVFTQTHKDAALNLKVTKSDDKIKATVKYTLNPFGVSSRSFVVTGGSYDVEFAGEPAQTSVVKTNTDGTKEYAYNYAKNVILPNGEANKFNHYFVITPGYVAYDKTDGEVYYADAAGSTIAIRKDLGEDDLETLLSKDGMKEDLTGYVTVTNGVRNVDLKITVAVENEAKKIKLKTTATPVLTLSGNSVSDITVMNGKETVDIEAYELTGKSGKTWGFQSYNEMMQKSDASAETKADEEAAEQARLEKGIIRVVAENPVKGSHEFELKVVAKDMVDGKKYVKNATTNKMEITFDNAPGTSGKIAVADAKNASNKIVFAKNATNWTVKNSDWWADTDGTNTWHVWSTDREFTFKNYMTGVDTIKAETESANAGWFHVDLNEPEGGKYNGMEGQGISLVVDKEGLDAAVKAPKSKLKYNKASKVKVTFSYFDAEGKEITTLKKDTVTFSITLPEEPSKQTAAELTTLLGDKKANLQNLANRKSRDYTPNEWKDKAEQKELIEGAAGHVADDLQNEAKRLANGTSAVIEVTSSAEYTENAYEVTAITYKYDVQVDKKIIYTLVSKYNYNGVYTDLEDALDDVVSELETPTEGTVEKYGLGYNPLTTADQFKEKLIKVLNDENVLTNGMTVNVTRVDADRYDEYGSLVYNGSRVPTTSDDGYFTADITVTDMGKRNVNNNSYRVIPKTVTYTFDQYTAESTYEQNGNNVITNTLNDAKMAELVLEANKKVTDGIDVKNNYKFTEPMQTALREEIRKFAENEIDNQYLHVKEVGTDGFFVDVTGTTGSEKWEINYVVTYEGSKTFDVIGKAEVSIATFKGLQKVDKLKTDVTNMMAALVLDSDCNTAAAALAKVESEVRKLSTNPTYDKLAVTFDGVEAEAFQAPTKDAAGWIKVNVNYADGEEEADNVPFTVMIKKLPATEGGEDVELSDADKAAAVVKSILTPTKINEVVAEAWEKAVEADNSNSITGMDGFAADNEKLTTGLAAAVKDANSLPTGYTIKDDKASVASIALPEDSDKTGTYGKITITLVKETAETSVEIDGGTLTKNDVYQSEGQFMDAVQTAVNGHMFDYDSTLVKSTETDGVKTYSFADGKSDADVITVIENYAKGLITGDFTKNPLYVKSGYKDNISGEKVETGTAQTSVIVNETTGAITASNVSLKFGNKGDSPTRTVSVECYGEGLKPVINKVEIKKVDNADVTDGDGAKEKPYVIASNTTVGADVTKTFGATVAASNMTGSDVQGVTWKLMSVNSDDDSLVEFEGVDNENLNEKITLGKETGVLTIPAKAYKTGAEEIDAVVVATSTVDDQVSGEFYVTIKLTENVTEVNITSGPAVIEAPSGDTPITTTYKAELAGDHVDPSKRSNVKWSFPANTPAAVSVNESTGVVSVTKAATDIAELVLTAAYGEGNKKKEDEQKIQIVANSKINTNTTITLSSVGEDAVWSADGADTEQKIAGTLAVHENHTNGVMVPISITSDRDVTKLKQAAFTVKKVAASSDVDVSGISVEVPATGRDKGKAFLKITKDAQVIPAAADAIKNDQDVVTTPAVPATVLKLTVTLPAEDGKPAVTEDFKFIIVIDKFITGINFNAAVDEEAAVDVTDNILEVEKAGSDEITVDLSGSTVVGAHVNNNADGDQKIKWVITSKESGSGAAIANSGADAGKLIIQNGGADDYIIKVKAVAVNDKNADGKASDILTVKLVDSVTP